MIAASVGRTAASVRCIGSASCMVAFWAKVLLLGVDYSNVMIFGFLKLSGSIKEKFLT
jgi:hypothetical protein